MALCRLGSGEPVSESCQSDFHGSRTRRFFSPFFVASRLSHSASSTTVWPLTSSGSGASAAAATASGSNGRVVLMRARGPSCRLQCGDKCRLVLCEPASGPVCGGFGLAYGRLKRVDGPEQRGVDPVLQSGAQARRKFQRAVLHGFLHHRGAGFLERLLPRGHQQRVEATGAPQRRDGDRAEGVGKVHSAASPNKSAVAATVSTGAWTNRSFWRWAASMRRQAIEK